jgi:hypothetical protein
MNNKKRIHIMKAFFWQAILRILLADGIGQLTGII